MPPDNLMPQTIYQIELKNLLKTTSAMEHDVARLIVCLQGLVNREFERHKGVIYLNFENTDPFWLDYLMKPNKLLAGFSIVSINTFEEFTDIFLPTIKKYGLIAWDPKVAATANVASTICALDEYIPVKYSDDPGSLYKILLGLGVPIRQSLTGMFSGSGKIPGTDIPSSGSAKCDAYLWALDRYFDRCSTEYIAYMPDGAGCVEDNDVYIKMRDAKYFSGNSIPNHDYLIARRCFFFDLSPIEDEAPCDDPNQEIGTDFELLKTIFEKRYQAANGEFGKIIGFPPWWLKYTNFQGQGKYEATVVEWKFTEFLTTYNLVKEADAAQPCCMTNGSIYYKANKPSNFKNNLPQVKQKYDPRKKYFIFYVGDYDSSAWMKTYVPPMWENDPQSGKLPLMWCYNPNLSDRIPMVFDYLNENKQPNDYFAAGDSGAGYIIPEGLFQKEGVRCLPSADEKWIEYCKPYYEQFDLNITGFIINAYYPITKKLMKMYNRISPAGSFQNDYHSQIVLCDGVPYIHLMNGVDTRDPGESEAKAMYDYASQNMKGCNFSAYRTVCATPSQLAQLTEAFIAYAKEKEPDITYELVDPYTFFDLIRQSGQGIDYTNRDED